MRKPNDLLAAEWMRRALRLARRGYGKTSPNPMVGALLVRGDRVIGEGWHHRAGMPHAEIEALRDAKRRGESVAGATLYVTLEPCCTHGRTPPCTGAIIEAAIARVVIGAIDPNPKHAGRGLRLLEDAGIRVESGLLAEECGRLNEAFNHWIVHRMPFVTVKAAMTLDGKLATASGESKWITGPAARSEGMRLRRGSDAIIAGVNTVLRDNPHLNVRKRDGSVDPKASARLCRVILDSTGRIPLDSHVLSDDQAPNTVVVVTPKASDRRIAQISKRAKVWVAPAYRDQVDARWVLRRLGREGVVSVLVEGGGEINAAFLLRGIAQRIAFFYASKILGGRDAIKAVAGKGYPTSEAALCIVNPEWRRLGRDWMLTGLARARAGSKAPAL